MKTCSSKGKRILIQELFRSPAPAGDSSTANTIIYRVCSRGLWKLMNTHRFYPARPVRPARLALPVPLGAPGASSIWDPGQSPSQGKRKQRWSDERPRKEQYGESLSGQHKQQIKTWPNFLCPIPTPLKDHMTQSGMVSAWRIVYLPTHTSQGAPHASPACRKQGAHVTNTRSKQPAFSEQCSLRELNAKQTWGDSWG